MKQEENETLDEYWKRLVDIERKCDFNNVTPEEIITYKFAATIKDKRARDKFIKGPLKKTIGIGNHRTRQLQQKIRGQKTQNQKSQKRIHKQFNIV